MGVLSFGYMYVVQLMYHDRGTYVERLALYVVRCILRA